MYFVFMQIAVGTMEAGIQCPYKDKQLWWPMWSEIPCPLSMFNDNICKHD